MNAYGNNIKPSVITRYYRLSVSLIIIFACNCCFWGCQVIGVVAHVADGIPKTVNVKAQYTGLADQTIAVIAAVDDYTTYQHPDLTGLICNSVSRHIMDHVPGALVTDPFDVTEYQDKHPYWLTLPYSELIESMHVQRLIIVDLVEYRLHEPGNVHLWQGAATANIGVVEAEARDPDNFAFYTTVNSRFPDQSSFGLIDADPQTMQLGLLGVFSLDVARLFYDYEVQE